MSTCDNVKSMTKMIQIRNVPESLHRTLKARAARLGMSLSDYLLSEIEEIAQKPSLAEWLTMVKQAGPVHVDEDPAEVIRRHRDA